jgi:pimeloyl-ACP methyl ester carboxylesterase
MNQTVLLLRYRFFYTFLRVLPNNNLPGGKISMRKTSLRLLSVVMILSMLVGNSGIVSVNAAGLPESALIIQEQGNFSTGGTVVTSEGEFDPMQPWMVPQGGQTRHGDHADVFYQIPVNPNDYSMVFLHGYGQSRRSWQTTADGREGFSNLFIRKGYSVYLVDQPGRGEAGQVTGSGEISAAPDDQTWFTQFRIGLWPEFNDGVQFPTDEKSLDQFFRMMVPDTGTTAEQNATVTAMSALFDQAGPGILFTHSASGGTGWQTAIANENVRAIVSIEPGGFAFPIDPDADPAQSFGGVEMDDFLKLTKIPIIVYYGDYIPDEETGIPSQDFWRQSLESARQWAELVNSNGGDVTIVHLPEIGITGNTHFIMSDLNNQIIADHIADWLEEKDLNKNTAETGAASFNLESGTVMLNNGMEMPVLGLGTYRLSEEETENSVSSALSYGYKLIDTAAAYGNEEAVGRGIKKSGVPREDVFISTKLWPSDYGNAAAAIDTALEKLDVEYIDLLLLHQPWGDDFINAYKAMEVAVGEGKVRAIGLSNVYQENFDAIIEIASIPPAVVQNERNPYFQQLEMMEYITPYGTVMMDWFPLVLC